MVEGFGSGVHVPGAKGQAAEFSTSACKPVAASDPGRYCSSTTASAASSKTCR